MSRRAPISALLGCCAALAFGPQPARAVVGGITSTADFSNPQSPWYGMNWNYVYHTGTPSDVRVGSNVGAGSAVAVGYFYLLTAWHFSFPSTLTIAGDTFEVVGTYTPPRDGSETVAPDLKLVQVRNVTTPHRPLPGFYQLYTGSLAGKDAIVVGWGYTGTTTTTEFYEVDALGKDKRWGTNRITSDTLATWQADGPDPDPYPDWSTRCLLMPYDKSKYGPTQYECGYGRGDSGGGVFVRPSGSNTWQLAGINLYVGRSEKPWLLGAASIGHYSGWLMGLLGNDRLPGDATGDGTVDGHDYVVLKENYGITSDAQWWQGDFDRDGDVDRNDLLILKTNFGYTSIPHPWIGSPAYGLGSMGDGLVPEPTAACVLAVGATLLLARRRSRGAR